VIYKSDLDFFDDKLVAFLFLCYIFIPHVKYNFIPTQGTSITVTTITDVLAFLVGGTTVSTILPRESHLREY
jgi:hypothetical protein